MREINSEQVSTWASFGFFGTLVVSGIVIPAINKIAQVTIGATPIPDADDSYITLPLKITLATSLVTLRVVL